MSTPHPEGEAGPIVRPDLIVCHDCAAVWRRRALAPGEIARCARCGDELGRGHAMTHEGQFALALAAFVVFLIANFSAVVVLEMGGSRTEATLLQAIRETWRLDQRLVAALAWATAFAFPLAVIGLRLYVLAPLTAGWRPPGFELAMRALSFAARWSMVEVLILAALVAFVRAASEAYALPGVGLFAFAVLAVLLTAHQAAGTHPVWARAEELAR